MRKLLLAICFIYTSILCHAQITIPTSGGIRLWDSTMEKEAWYYVGNDDAYIINYDLTPVGISHAYNEMIKLCNKYNLEIVNPTVNKSTVSSIVTSETDFENIYLTIVSGHTEISKFWIVGKSYLYYKASSKEVSILVSVN